LKRDQKFFDMYSLVIGILAIFSVAVLVLAMKMSDGQVYFPGEEANAAAPQVAEATHSEPVVTAMSGPQVYNAACIACHGSGIGGAPTVGDAAAWQARIAQGNDTLYLHAIEGYTGSTGFMPQKGGRMDLSDDEVHGAVDYMVGESQN